MRHSEELMLKIQRLAIGVSRQTLFEENLTCFANFTCVFHSHFRFPSEKMDSLRDDSQIRNRQHFERCFLNLTRMVDASTRAERTFELATAFLTWNEKFESNLVHNDESLQLFLTVLFSNDMNVLHISWNGMFGANTFRTGLKAFFNFVEACDSNANNFGVSVLRKHDHFRLVLNQLPKRLYSHDKMYPTKQECAALKQTNSTFVWHWKLQALQRCCSAQDFVLLRQNEAVFDSVVWKMDDRLGLCYDSLLDLYRFGTFSVPETGGGMLATDTNEAQIFNMFKHDNFRRTSPPFLFIVVCSDDTRNRWWQLLTDHYGVDAVCLLSTFHSWHDIQPILQRQFTAALLTYSQIFDGLSVAVQSNRWATTLFVDVPPCTKYNWPTLFAASRLVSRSKWVVVNSETDVAAAYILFSDFGLEMLKYLESRYGSNISDVFDPMLNKRLRSKRDEILKAFAAFL